MTREMQIKEAVKRMKNLNIHPNAIRELEKENKINVSTFMGALFWATEEQQKIIKEFESRHNAVVYHCIDTYSNFGHLLNMLFVSEYEEEWEMDNDDIVHGQVIAMVENLDDPFCSDMGSIGIKSVAGGLIRTW